jgi:plasmid stabilization system protein ParE
MRKLLVQPQARLDMLETWHWIATDSLESANRVAGKLDDAIHGLVLIRARASRAWM